MQYALFYIDFFVNNIQKNHHLTALNGDFIIVCVTFLIRLFIGLSPFLRYGKKLNGRKSCLCQCPLSGFLHFYECFGLIETDNQYMCQCPLSGFLHFYNNTMILNGDMRDVSMPFIGLSPFLRSPLGTP